MHKIATICMIAVFASCSLNNADNVVISTVEPLLVVQLGIERDDPQSFAIRLATIEKTCETTELIASGVIQDDRVRVDIEGLNEPEECAVSESRIQKDLALMVQPITYDVTMSIGTDLENIGTLTFDGETYKLDMRMTEGISIGYSELQVIPVSTIWGKISGTGNVPVYFDEFLKAVAPSTEDAELKPGYYGAFMIDSTNAFDLVPEVIGTSTSSSFDFVLRVSGDIEQLQSAIDVFRSNYPGAELECTGWDGRSF